MTNKTGAARTPAASKCLAAMTLIKELQFVCLRIVLNITLLFDCSAAEPEWKNRITLTDKESQSLWLQSRLGHPTLHLLMYIVLFPTSERKVITDTKVFYCRKAAKTE